MGRNNQKGNQRHRKSPFTLRWLTPEDKARTKNADSVRRSIKKFIVEVWDQLPDTSKSVLTAAIHFDTLPYEGLAFRLINRALGTDERFGGYVAKVNNGNLYLNVSDFEKDPPNPAHRPMYWRYHIAHELGHLYNFIRSALILVPSRVQDEMQIAESILDGFAFKGLMPDMAFSEKMADALVIVWGFGEDFITTIMKDGFVHPNDSWCEGNGLGPELADLCWQYEIEEKKCEEEDSG